MIEVEKLSREFDTGGFAPRRALDGISLSFREGQWCNLLGPNGSGKSTLLRLLAGEMQPSSGDIRVDGRSILRQGAARRARQFFFVEQDTRANLVPSMTIEENLLLTECRSRIPGLGRAMRRARRERIRQAVEALGLGLEQRLRTQARLLSGGERQAVVLAEALMTNAPVLLLDEFLAAMDPRSGPLLLKAARDVARAKNLTVLSVTHNLDHVMTQSSPDDRVVVLQNGCVVQDLLLGDLPSTEWLAGQYESVVRLTLERSEVEETECQAHPYQPAR